MASTDDVLVVVLLENLRSGLESSSSIRGVMRQTCRWIRDVVDRTTTTLTSPSSSMCLSYRDRTAMRLLCLGRLPILRRVRTSSIDLFDAFPDDFWYGRPFSLSVELGSHEQLSKPSRIESVCAKAGHLIDDLSVTSAGLVLSPIVSACPGLERLVVVDRCISSLEPLSRCLRLEWLSLHECSRVTSLTPLSSCIRLRTLDMLSCCRVASLDALMSCPQLGHLNLWFCSAIKSLVPLPSLESLDMRFCTAIRSLGPLSSCSLLRRLTMTYCEVDNLKPLSLCTRLETLSISGCTAIVDLAGLGSCVGLRVLDMYGCTGVLSLAPIASCPLVKLDMTSCVGVSDLGPLAACVRSIEVLNMTKCTSIRSLAPLARCPMLRIVYMWECEHLAGDDVDGILSSQPSLEIYRSASRVKCGPAGP